MRTRNLIVVLGPDGKPLAGAKVHTTIRSSGVDASVYAAETGATPGENPATTDTKGMIVQWLDRGAYNSTVTAEGMEPYVEPWDSAPASDGAIDQVWLSPELKDGEAGHSTTRKLGHEADEALAGNDPRILSNGLQDILQAGVVASTDWSFTANIIGGTGALGSTGATGGIAWLPDPVITGALVRSVTTPAVISGLIPASLPTSGKYRNIGFELTSGEWGAGATVSVKAGTEKNTQAEAEAAPPAISGGKNKIRNVVVKNTSGVYSIVAQFDMRKSSENMVKTGDLMPSMAESKWGFLKCDFSAVGRFVYSDLFAVIGTSCGPGDGVLTFNLPEGTGRTMIGAGEAKGATGATSHALGSKGGEEKHALTEAEMPPHTHTYEKTLAAAGVANGSEHVVREGTASTDTGSTGSGTAHNNMQSFFTGNWFIKY